MCGVASIYAYGASAPPVDRDELLRCRDAMLHRGPDGAGLWLSRDGRVGLAHRRLAIIDLTDNGAQPMATADGALRITFNGEIYNYRELRRELEAKGYCFQSQSVYLEAMACGVPTLASKVDGGREALRDGMLGILVNPDDSAELSAGVKAVLNAPREVPDGLSYLSRYEFDRRLNSMLEGVFAAGSPYSQGELHR